VEDGTTGATETIEATDFLPTIGDPGTTVAVETATTKTIGIARSAETIISHSEMNATAAKRLDPTVEEAEVVVKVVAKMVVPTDVNGSVDATTTGTTTGIAVNAATQILLSAKNATCAAPHDPADVASLVVGKTIASKETTEVQTGVMMTGEDATTARLLTTIGIAVNVAIPISPSAKNATAAKRPALVAVVEVAVAADGPKDVAEAATGRNDAHRVDTTVVVVAADGPKDENAADGPKDVAEAATLAVATDPNVARKEGTTEDVVTTEVPETVLAVLTEVHSTEVAHPETMTETRAEGMAVAGTVHAGPTEKAVVNSVHAMTPSAVLEASDPGTLTIAHQETSGNLVRFNAKTRIEQRREQ